MLRVLVLSSSLDARRYQIPLQNAAGGCQMTRRPRLLFHYRKYSTRVFRLVAYLLLPRPASDSAPHDRVRRRRRNLAADDRVSNGEASLVALQILDYQREWVGASQADGGVTRIQACHLDVECPLAACAQRRRQLDDSGRDRLVWLLEIGIRLHLEQSSITLVIDGVHDKGAEIKIEACTWNAGARALEQIDRDAIERIGEEVAQVGAYSRSVVDEAERQVDPV